MTTAGDQVERALRLIGVLAEGETASAEIMQDSLMSLNQMLDSWSTERLSVFTSLDQVFTWPAGVVSRTLGPTGNLVGVRPVTLDSSSYYIDPVSGVSAPLTLVDQDQYNAIPVKTTTGITPALIHVESDVPDVTVFIYPVPTVDVVIHFVSMKALSQVASVGTELVFPPGYLRAFAYNLAMELAPEFGVEPSQQVQRIAMTSKRNLKRINNPDDKLLIPPSLTGQSGYSIYSDS